MAHRSSIPIVAMLLFNVTFIQITMCTVNIVCGTVWDEKTSSNIQLVPVQVEVPPNIMSSARVPQSAKVWACVRPDIDECLSVPCRNGGNCTQQINGYVCQCLPGFEGIDCEINVDDCVTNPCLNNGYCLDGRNAHYCICADGFSGDTCQHFDECSSDPCQNGGTCSEFEDSYTCQCRAGFEGVHCETDVDDCESAPCLNNGDCLDDVNAYTCDCQAGFQGANCEINIDECLDNSCLNGGNCTDGINSYTCTCQQWFRGDRCERRGSEIHTATTAERSSLNIDCDLAEIHIVYVSYGLPNAGCPSASNSLPTVKTSCEGRPSCSVQASNQLFGDPCPGTSKQLEVQYECLHYIHTDDSGQSHIYHWIVSVENSTDTRFDFFVSAASDAHIGLADGVPQSSYVEIVLCGWSNTQSVIRRCVGTCPGSIVQFQHTLCDQSQFVGFWISFDGGSYKVGVADETEPFMEWSDPNPFNIKHVGVFSGYGSDADWLYY